jgi:hypothetical protein
VGKRTIETWNGCARSMAKRLKVVCAKQLAAITSLILGGDGAQEGEKTVAGTWLMILSP